MGIEILNYAFRYATEFEVNVLSQLNLYHEFTTFLLIRSVTIIKQKKLPVYSHKVFQLNILMLSLLQNTCKRQGQQQII